MFCLDSSNVASILPQVANGCFIAVIPVVGGTGVGRVEPLADVPSQRAHHDPLPPVRDVCFPARIYADGPLSILSAPSTLGRLSAFPRPDGQIARSGCPPNHKVRSPCARRLPRGTGRAALRQRDRGPEVGSSAIDRSARSARALASFASYADPLLSHTEIVSSGPERHSDLGLSRNLMKGDTNENT